MDNKTPKIKEIITKIDIGKVVNYLPEHSTSKTLRQIIRYSRRILDSNNEQEIFKLAVRLAYNLDIIVNVSQYVKNETEKKYWLGISKELFENTVGVKDKK